MILLLGASGYVGRSLASSLRRRGIDLIAPSRADFDFSDAGALKAFIRRTRPSFVINAVGFVGIPNVDSCESKKAECVAGNVLLPLAVGLACAELDIPWGHVSSGCIFSGCLVEKDGRWTAHKDINDPEVRRIATEEPHRVRGYDETMAPNFSFRDGPCSFYSGTKALAEESIARLGRHYVWRLRIPFSHQDGPRNYLSKLLRYDKVFDALNSLSHLDDFAEACLDCIGGGVAFGTYNVVNPGFVSSRYVVGRMQAILGRRDFGFWKDDTEFYAKAAKTPRSNCLLDPSKLLQSGIKMRPVKEAIDDALNNWQPETL